MAAATMVRQRFPWVQLIQNHENLGFAAANNQAIKASCGRYILLLNPDTQVIAGALQALVHFMDSESAGRGSRFTLTQPGRFVANFLLPSPIP